MVVGVLCSHYFMLNQVGCFYLILQKWINLRNKSTIKIYQEVDFAKKKNNNNK